MSWLNVPINQRPLVCRHAKGQIYIDPNIKKEVVQDPVEESPEVMQATTSETIPDCMPEAVSEPPKKRGRPKKNQDPIPGPDATVNNEPKAVIPDTSDNQVEVIKVG